MNKLKIINIGLIALICAFVVLSFLKMKHHNEFLQKEVLAQEIHKVLGRLMLDLNEAQQNTIQDAPADGQWHSRIAFDHTKLGALEYVIKDGHLWRKSDLRTEMIADHIGAMRIRRQIQTPDLLEVQIEAMDGVSLLSNFKIRMSH